MRFAPMPSTKKATRDQKKIRELSVEDYLCLRVKQLGGLATKNNANWYIGIPDRTVRVLGYMCDVELKRPKGGKLSGAQKMWKKMLTNAGTPWHLIVSHDEVDAFIEMVERRCSTK
jgi:hypothetical protein